MSNIVKFFTDRLTDKPRSLSRSSKISDESAAFSDVNYVYINPPH